MTVAVAVAVSGGVAVPVAVPVAGLTKRFFNQKDFLVNVWGYCHLSDYDSKERNQPKVGPQKPASLSWSCCYQQVRNVGLQM